MNHQYQTETKTHIRTKTAYPLLLGNERLLIWEKVKGMWRNREPDAIDELDEMRDEWDRPLLLNNS